MPLTTPGGTVSAGKGSFGELEIATGAITSGTYTPTLTNGTNVDASTAYECQYLRVGSTVTVSGKVDVDSTASSTYSNVDISLPIASNLANDEDCSGACSGVNSEAGYINADTANNRAGLWFPATVTSNTTIYFTFAYQVI